MSTNPSPKIVKDDDINWNKSNPVAMNTLTLSFDHRITYDPMNTNFEETDDELNHRESDDEEEFSAVEYAHTHGLATDHLNEPLPIPDILALQQELPSTIPTPDSDLPPLELISSSLIDERLSVDKNAAHQLAIMNSYAIEPTDLLSDLLDCRRSKYHKVEMPLLKTDHESDVRSWNVPEAITIHNAILATEILDEENNEGLRWPSKMWTLPATLMQGITSEKLEIKKEDMKLLQMILQDEYVDGGLPKKRADDEEYKRVIMLQLLLHIDTAVFHLD
jgi:hypothetical protein